MLLRALFKSPLEVPRKAKNSLSDYQSLTAFFIFSCTLYFVTCCKSVSCIFAFLCVLRGVAAVRSERVQLDVLKGLQLCVLRGVVAGGSAMGCNGIYKTAAESTRRKII